MPARKQGGEAGKQRACVFDAHCREDLAWWVDTNRKTALRILDLVEAVMRNPYEGPGKPEPLKGLRDTWSRRISEEHRLVYHVAEERITFLQARFHY